MDRLFIILSTITLGFILAVHIPLSYSQVQDKTVAGVIVPKVVSTQSQYCSKGTCGTGGTPKIPATYTKTTEHYPVLLISLSKTCEILDKNGMKGCPTVKELMKYDTSNKMISGKFVKNGDVYIRTPPQVKNNWLAYAYSKNTIICVECYFDGTAASKSQQIIIQPNSFSYVNKTETENKNAWYNFDNRYMQGCDVATISNVSGLLNDTINLMLHKCDIKYTTFHGMTNHTRVLQPWSYDNPYSTLHQVTYLKDVMHGKSTSNTNHTSGGYGPSECFIHQCNFKDPYAKKGY